MLGEIAKLPSHISECNITYSMNIDLNKFATLMRNSAQRRSSIIESTKKKSFAKERVIVKSKIFRSIFLNCLLKLIFFGVNFSLIRDKEIINMIKRTIVLYLHSKDRIKSIFEVAGVSPFSVLGKEEDGIMYGSSERVILKIKRSRLQVSGYVILEEENENGDNELKIQLESNECVKISTPSYCDETGMWQYQYYLKYEILEYDPMQIKI